MATYEITVTNTDSGNSYTIATDSVAEGETDVWEITVENPELAPSASQTSGN